MPTLTINGKTIEVPAGTNLIEAARQAGAAVPHFCYHPDLPIAGNCRMCLVHIEKMPKLQIACNTVATEGMVVTTQNGEVDEAVKGVLEFLLKNHPVDCPICDQAGECKLQDYYMEVGLHDSRVDQADKVHKRKTIDIGEMIVLDRERCVLCSRCIRFGEQVLGGAEFGFANRGDHVQITTFNDQPLKYGYAGNYADMCPVGALTSRDFRFKKRVWLLQGTPSVCTGCSTGCNIQIDHEGGDVFRFVPRRNADVNASWMCDDGRLSYKKINAEDRVTTPMRHHAGAPVASTWAETTRLFADALQAAGGAATAMIASPQATNESLAAFQALAEAVGAAWVDYRADGSHALTEEREDAVLRRKDHSPNNKGCAAIVKTTSDVDAILAACEAGTVKVLYLLGTELLTNRADADRVAKALAKVETVAVHAEHWTDALENVALVFPAASVAEQDGTYTNYAGRVQRVKRAFAPRGACQPHGAVAREALRQLGKQTPPETAAATFKHLAESNPAFAGLTWAGLEPHKASAQDLSAVISLHGAKQNPLKVSIGGGVR